MIASHFLPFAQHSHRENRQNALRALDNYKGKIFCIGSILVACDVTANDISAIAKTHLHMDHSGIAVAHKFMY